VHNPDVSKPELLAAIRRDQSDLEKYRGYVRKLRAGGKVSNLTLEKAEHIVAGLESTIATKNKMASRARNGKSSKPKWVVVRSSGMDDKVISTHTTKEAALKAEIRAGGGDGGMMNIRVVEVGPDAMWEIVDLTWGKQIRPRQIPTSTKRLANKLKRS
jgi:hypothetical protein